ncbi:hypothetical protein [Streptomyces sp. NPDC058694]|uniref:hypothetical protein n=1 Tax=Streptomyces sp. NPDC058694 TaxID=3346603 RepID=UPI00365F62AB
MIGDGGSGESVFDLPLPACLVKSIKDQSWMNLANSPKIEEIFGQAAVRPAFYSIAGMIGMTKWWRVEIDEETLQYYFGTSEECAAPDHMTRMKTVIIGTLGPDLPIALDYRGSPVDPIVTFLGEDGAWQKISENVCDLILALDSQRANS